MAKERQTSPTLSGIRADHRERYNAAIHYAGLKNCRTVMDVGCGVGYGSYMMAKAGLQAIGFDRSKEAIAVASQSYVYDRLEINPVFMVDTLEERIDGKFNFDMITAFEILEHTNAAAEFLERRSYNTRYIVGSVPNEDIVPFTPEYNVYHVRHYTAEQLHQLLTSTGWDVKQMGGQRGKHGRDALIDWKSVDGARCLVFQAASVRVKPN